jgi:S1-C subfamily serine protease
MTQLRYLLATCLVGAFVFQALPVRGQGSFSSVKTEQATLTFSNLLVRDERHKELYYTTGDYRVYILEALRKSGFRVLGAENLLFGQDKSADARFVLGGTITATICNIDPKRPRLCEMTVTWELFDTALQGVIYKVDTRGFGALTNKKDSVSLLMASLGSLARRPLFRSALHPRDEARSSASIDEPATFAACPMTYDLPADMQKAQQATVIVRVGAQGGSGVLVSTDGVVLTANHVVEALSTATVELADGRKLPARVIRRDTQRDVAVLRVDAPGLPCLPVSMSLPNVGQTLFAVGNPLSERLSFSVTRGLVSGLREQVDAAWIQTDAALNPGNSGGPILNEQGAIIGIVSHGIRGLGIQGISFGLSSASALAVLQLAPGDVTTLPISRAIAPPAQVSTYVDEPDARYKDTPYAKDRELQDEKKRVTGAWFVVNGFLVATGALTLIVAGAGAVSDQDTAWILGGVLSGIGVGGLVLAPFVIQHRYPTKARPDTSVARGLALTISF